MLVQANGSKDQAPQEVEVEQWVLDFAALFREQLGVDHERPLDLQAHAWEQLQSALDMSVRDERSLPLFDKAAERFQEMSAQGIPAFIPAFFGPTLSSLFNPRFCSNFAVCRGLLLPIYIS